MESPIYIVTFIQHTGKDEITRYFFNENDARKYIRFLGNAIENRQKATDVGVHFESGKENIHKLLNNMPMNSYTSFKTPKDTFSITLARAK